ncbi:MAG: ATP-binding protein [Vicinamibacterales bacterium]
MFVQLLCAALDLRPPLGSADAVAARIRALDPALEPYVPLFLHLLSMNSDVHPLPRHLRGEHLQAALLDALAMLISVLSRRTPLAVLIEDWHWADSGSRAAFGRIAELVQSMPLALIVTSRDEQDAESSLPAHATLVRLGRLDYTSSVAIAAAALGVPRVPDALACQLYDRAGGNPFFLEQICAALIERDAVTVRDGSALVAGGENALVLPHTVQGVIRARLDNLNSEALEIARVAAVIGWEFDHALLADVVAAHVDLRSAIAALETAGLIQKRSSGRTVGYRFTHALTQEVCYDSLVGHQRKLLHGAIGRALASIQTDPIDERASLLAHHFGRAEDWPAAIRFGRRAAERSIELSQFGDALAILDQLVEWARRLPGEQNDLLADLLLQQERLCETLGLRARQQQIIDTLIAQLAREEGSARLAVVYLRQGDLSTLLKRFDAADRALATALRIGQDRDDGTLLASALRSLGLLRWHQGRHEEAVEITRRVLALDRERDDDVAVALDLTNLGNILRAVGDYDGARARLEEALGMPALWTDPKKLVYTQHNLANLYRAMGDFDRALECLVQSNEICRTHLLPIQRSFHLTSIAHIHLQLGRIDQALATYRTAVDLSRRARHAEGLVQSLRMLGNALLGLTRYDEALPYLDEAAQLFGQLEDRASEAEMRGGIARILELRSPDRAAEAWNIVLALHRRRGDMKGELEAREGLARALRSKGPEVAIPAFESALALASTLGNRAREAAIGNVLGILEWERGGFAPALRHYETVLALVRDQGSRTHEVIVLNSLGACLTRLGRPDEARTVLTESLTLSREIGERQLEAHALSALGHVLLNAHDLHRAAECFEHSLTIRQALGDRAGAGWMYLRLAEVRQRSGDTAQASAAYTSAAAVAAETGDDALSAAVASQATDQRATDEDQRRTHPLDTEQHEPPILTDQYGPGMDTNQHGVRVRSSYRSGESADASLHHRAIGSRSDA